jgi:ubiquinone/menaquinone biosynthesis C-methylase UbiE
MISEEMDADEFSKVLMSDERKLRQNPDSIISQVSISKGSVVADLACGPGYFTIPFSRAVGPNGVVYAVDSNPGMIKNLKKNLARSGSKNVRVIEADVTKTGIPSRTLDVILFSDVLHDLTERSAFFAELRRIAKKKAMILDIDWQKLDQEIGPPVEIRLSEDESRALVTRNGFSVIREIEAGTYHYGLVFQIKD